MEGAGGPRIRVAAAQDSGSRERSLMNKKQDTSVIASQAAAEIRKLSSTCSRRARWTPRPCALSARTRVMAARAPSAPGNALNRTKSSLAEIHGKSATAARKTAKARRQRSRSRARRRRSQNTSTPSATSTLASQNKLSPLATVMVPSVYRNTTAWSIRVCYQTDYRRKGFWPHELQPSLERGFLAWRGLSNYLKVLLSFMALVHNDLRGDSLVFCRSR